MGQRRPNLADFYRKAIKVRRSSKALSEGGVESAWIADTGGYGFLRRYEQEAILALFNNSELPIEADIQLAEGAPEGEWADLLGTIPAVNVEGNILHATIPPLCAAWLQAPR